MAKRSALMTALLVALAFARPAVAQVTPPASPNDYKLPPGDASTAPPVQGPVDPAHPVAEPIIAPPPATVPVQKPATQEPAAPAVAPKPPAARAAPPRPAQPQAAPAAPQTPSIVAPKPMPAPQPSISRPAPAPAPPAAPAPMVEKSASPWWLAAGALAILLAAGLALVFLARPRKPQPEPVAEDKPPPKPPVLAEPRIPEPCFSTVDLDVAFQPLRLMMTLVNARLTYRLSITNQGKDAIGAVAVSADLIGAHSALSPAEQLDFAGDAAQHATGRIEASEVAQFAGELVIPLASIPPVRAGDAHFFAALARFAIRVTDAAGASHLRKALFVVGEDAGDGAPQVRLARLDLGPRTLSALAGREIDTRAHIAATH